MSINNITPEEWDALNGKIETLLEPAAQELRKRDMVNKPPHYTHGEIECVDYQRQQLGTGFRFYALGQVLKYLHRFQFKGTAVEDLHKCQWYLNRLIEEYDYE